MSLFATSLPAQILAPTPPPGAGPTPPAINVLPIIPAPSPYPDARVPSVPLPSGPGMPASYRTPSMPVSPSLGTLPRALPKPQTPPKVPDVPLPSGAGMPHPFRTPSESAYSPLDASLPQGSSSPLGSPSALIPPPPSFPVAPTPPSRTPSKTPASGAFMPSGPSSPQLSPILRSSPAPSDALNTPSSGAFMSPGTSSSLPPLLQPTPFSSVPLNTPPPGALAPSGTASSLSPSLRSHPFPSIPLNTPPPGTFAPGTLGNSASPNFPSSLLPPVPTAPVPTASIPRIRVAKTTELSPHAPKLTLDGAVQYALSHNPDVLSAVEQIRLTQGQYISVRAQLLPQLVATGSFGGQSPILANPPRPIHKLDIPGVDSTAFTTGSANNYLWDIRIGVQQLVFDGGGALSATRAAHYVADKSYFALRSTIDNVIANVKIAFFQVILNRSLIVVQEQSVALLENQLEDQESRYQAGTVPKFNVLQAQVAVANAVPPLITARNNLRVSQYQLVKLLGMNYTGDPTQVPFNVIGDLTINFRKIIPEEAVRTGLTRNPSLKAQRQSILAQAANITASLSGFYPRITFGGGFLAQNNFNYSNIGNTVEGWFFGLNGSWNIFDGLNTYGQVVQAKAQLSQAKISYDNTVRTVILNIQQDISYLQQAQETIESQQASVIQATEALRLARERLDAGAGTQLDILNAQVALLQAQTTVLQAKFSYIQALAQYDAALSLSTRYVETFQDPLENKEKWRFAKLNGAGYVMPRLPRVYRNQDPVRPILGPTPLPSMPPSRHRAHSARTTTHPHQ